MDNFYVRSLLGGDVYETTPPGQITAAHASQAIEVLSDFDAVLILENLDRGFDQLFHRLGWCRPNNAELRQSFGPGDETIHFSAEDRRKLARLNVHATASTTSRGSRRGAYESAARGRWRPVGLRGYGPLRSRGGRGTGPTSRVPLRSVGLSLLHEVQLLPTISRAARGVLVVRVVRP